MYAWIHRRIDRSPRPTYVHERRAALAFETVLLLVCAIPLVTSVRSAVAQAVIALLQLSATELRRELASIDGRHAERGGVSPLPEAKAALHARLESHLEIVAWTWPGLATLVAAAEAGRLALPAVLVLLATFARAWWARVAYPAWRRSRLAWNALHLARVDPPRAVVPFDGRRMFEDQPSTVREGHPYRVAAPSDEPPDIPDTPPGQKVHE